jgi:hypothetical protein
MQNSILNPVRVAAMLFLVLGLAGGARAQYARGVPWHVGDVAVCFGDGTCNMLRVTGTNTVTLLDQFSDGLTGAATTNGAAINNSLHLLVTDTSTSSNTGSNIVEYSIASINPSTGATVAHTPVTTFDGEGTQIQAVALNNAGDMFVLNNNSGSPTIVELNQDGGKVGSISLSSCSINAAPLNSATSMDLSANGSYAWVTSGSTIQQVTLSTAACTEFANFGPNVTVYGIKDIPPGALANVAPNCKGATCPSDESLLVVATGVIDPAGVNIDICTDAQASTPVTDSCGLLIDTNPSDPGLTAPLWQTATPYSLSAKILDPSLELQRATTAGTSGTTKPPFSETGGTAIDNAVIWTNQGRPAWSANAAYAIAPPLPTTGTYIVDSNSNLQTVSRAGTSGPTQPTWAASGTTTDGLVWMEQFGPVSGYSPHSSVYGTSPATLYVVDTSSFVWEALQAGTSGTGCCNDATFKPTPDNSVTWMDQGQQYWHPSFAFSQGAIIVDPNSHVQKVTTAGISGASLPAFSQSGGTISDGLIWTDLGAPLGSWQMNTQYSQNQIVTDNNVPAHYQQVVVAGTSGGSEPTFNATGGDTLDQSFLPPPASPSFAVMAVGSLPINTYYLELTFVNQYGETLPSAEAQVTVTVNNSEIIVQPPVPPSAAPADEAIGYNVYVSTSSGTETLQNATPVSLGAPFTESALVAGRAVPASNTATSSVVWHDLGQTGGMWMAGTFYPQNAVILDSETPSPHVQQATSAGTSGLSAPASFSTPPGSTAGNMANDNAVMWTDEGALGASIPAGYRWAASTAYPNVTTAEIVDTAIPPHVQLASATVTGPSGTSGTPNPPVFVDGGKSPLDGSVVWTDEGQQFWQPNTPFSVLSIIVDGGNHVQQATTAGTSGPVQPIFKDAGGMLTDGLVWTDRGVPGSWAANTPYALNAVISANGHVQQVVAASGSSGSTLPSSFSTSTTGVLTIDGSVVWQDRGVPGAWTASTPYALNAVILDSETPSPHVQQVTSAGTSGLSAPAIFSSADTSTAGSVVADNAVVWTDQGALGLSTPANFRWAAGTMYPNVNTAEIVDSNNHVQKATTAGTSGGSAPSFIDGGTVIDGLIWTFVTGPVVPYPPAAPVAIGTQIIDPNLNLQKAIEAGTPTPLITGAQWQTSGNTIDNAVIWTESRPSWAQGTYTVGNAGTLILDTNNNVELVTNNNLSNKVNSTSGTTGPSQPSAAGNNAWNPATGGMTIDGLQWTNQVSTPDSSVIARYPIAGVTTLESTALDPLVSNCQNNVCTTTVSPSPYPLPTIKNFWLGDSASPTFYRLDFATGTYTSSTYDANQSCSGCKVVSGIESLVPYGSEGSNQPDLAELFSGSLGTTAATDAETVEFLGNTLTASVYTSSNTPPTSAVPLTLYASPVNPASDFSDSPPIPNGVPCDPTYPSTSPFTTCIVWKSDLFSLQPIAGDYLSEKFAGPSSITTNTDVYTDAAFDTTVFVGNIDPGQKNAGSVEGLSQLSPTYSQAQSGCAYISPLPACYQPSVLPVLPFAFQCPKAFPGSKLDELKPTLSIVQFYPNVFPTKSFTTPQLKGVNGTANYAFYSSFLSFLDVFAFDWITPTATTTQYYQATTFDLGVIASFAQNFILSPNCLANPWISAISPTSGPPGTSFTITGLFFEPGATVTFINPTTGEVVNKSPTVRPTSITTTVPPLGVPPTGLPLGLVNVVVTNPNGLSYTLTNGFNIN